MAGFSGSMRQAERELRLKGLIKYTIGTEYVLEPEDFVSVRISEGVDTGILPGAVISAACTMVMNNSGGQFDAGGTRRGYAEMSGAEITLEIGVKNDAGEWLYAPMGVYYVDESAAEVNSAVVSLECHDSVYHRTGKVFDDGLSYPCLLSEIFVAAAEQAGYSYDGILPDTNLIMDKKPAWKDASVRDVMGHVAAQMGCCVLVDRWGYLDMRPLAGERTAFVIYPEEYMARTFREGRFGPVTKLEITTVNGADDEDSEAQKLSFSSGSGAECALELKTNPLFVTGAAHVARLGEKMMAAVAGLEYTRCEFSWRGDPDLMPGRYLKLVGLDGEATFCTISRQTLVFEGGFHAECVCGVPGDGELRQNSLGWKGSVSADSIVGVIPGANIGFGSITAVKLAAGAVNADKIAAGAVTADKIDAGAVTAEKLAADSVTADKISAGAVTADKIAADSVTTDKINAGAIDADRIAAGAVTAEKISAGAIDADRIAAGAVMAEKIAADAITSEKIAAGAITADKIAADSIDAGRIAAGAVTAEKIAADAVTAEHIRAGTITADKGIIADGAIGTAQIADGSITEAKIVSLNADVIQTGTLSADRLLLAGDDGVIYKINATSSGLSMTELQEDQYKNYINGTVIVAKSITAAQIAAQSITGNEILAGSITAKEIDVSDLFAAEATIQQLNAMDITGNKYLRLMVNSIEASSVGATQLLRNSKAMGDNEDMLADWSMVNGTLAADGEGFGTVTLG